MLELEYFWTRDLFKFVNRRLSKGAKSVEYGGWGSDSWLRGKCTRMHYPDGKRLFSAKCEFFSFMAWLKLSNELS